jgi:hypothetical protein
MCDLLDYILQDIHWQVQQLQRLLLLPFDGESLLAFAFE